MTEDKEQIFIIDSRSMLVRIVLLILLILALAFGWFAVRWQLGNLLAMVNSPNQENAKVAAEAAFGLAPNDPKTNFLMASVKKDSDPEYTEGFVDVVKLSPFDYRWWIQLGRAYEQAEKPKEAEKAFLKAVELAPTYTFPHWQIGNFYLRQNRDVAAFKELKMAARDNSVYGEQIFSMAWDFYEQDADKLEEIVGDSSDVRAGLSKFYAAKELPKRSLEMWNSLNDEDKKKNDKTARVIAQALYDKRFLLSAVEFVSQLGIEKDAMAETIYNAGFEDNFGDSASTFFGWRRVQVEKMRVTYATAKKYEGKRSLQITFSGFNKIEVNNIYQTIAVKPDARYKLSFWVKTENLRSAGMPKIEILSFSDSQAITTSEAFPDGTNDWKQISVNFTVPSNSQGITIRTARNYCGEKCLINGTLWYDSFKLEKLSGE